MAFRDFQKMTKRSVQKDKNYQQKLEKNVNTEDTILQSLYYRK